MVMKKQKLVLGSRYLIFRWHFGPFMTWRFELESGLTRWL
jgi:hypothetical protein